MKYLICALSFTVCSALALTAHAEKYSCSGVGGVDEWTIYVDTELQKAGVFDNDNTVIVPSKKMMLIETNPPQLVYEFEGKDLDGTDIFIYFNQTRLKASVTFKANSPNAKTEEAEFGCAVEPNLNLAD